MKYFSNNLTAEEIARIVGGETNLIDDRPYNSIAEPSYCNTSAVIFLEKESLLEAALNSNAGLIITDSNFAHHFNHRNVIVVAKPYLAILMLIRYWLKLDEANQVHEIDSTSQLANDVILGSNVEIGANAVIEHNVTIGQNSIIKANCFIGENTHIGDNCIIYPNVVIYPETEIGDNVIIHSGVVIGSDGFGFILFEGKQEKIPQIGKVIIQDDVEIGSNTSIDRATIGSTIIGQGTKIDNLVQIGHNCVIGKNCIICAQVGLAGSTVVGDYVYLAGQVGAAGHLKIGDGVLVGAQSGIANDLEAGKKYFGYPAREAILTKKIMAIEKNLPEMYKFFLHQQKKEHGDDGRV